MIKDKSILFLDPAYYYGSSLLEVVRATQNVFGGGVEEKVEGAKEGENKDEKGNLLFLSRD